MCIRDSIFSIILVILCTWSIVENSDSASEWCKGLPIVNSAGEWQRCDTEQDTNSDWNIIILQNLIQHNIILYLRRKIVMKNCFTHACLIGLASIIIVYDIIFIKYMYFCVRDHEKWTHVKVYILKIWNCKWNVENYITKAISAGLNITCLLYTSRCV